MLKTQLRRVRRFMVGEVLSEVAGLRAEISALRYELTDRAAIAERTTLTKRDELGPLVRQMESALLTIALGGAATDDSRRPAEGACGLGPPLNP